MSEFRECPFCGEQEARLIKSDNYYHVRCNYCGAEGERGINKQSAVDDWNTRDNELAAEEAASLLCDIHQLQCIDCPIVTQHISNAGYANKEEISALDKEKQEELIRMFAWNCAEISDSAIAKLKARIESANA